MLIVFAPQILLYGLAVVLYGILQAHRKVAAPALAPVLSSLVVIGAYFWFATWRTVVDLSRPGTTDGLAHPGRRDDGRGRDAGSHPRSSRLPDFACGSGPVLRFPAGVGARVRSWPWRALPRSSPRTPRWRW